MTFARLSPPNFPSVLQFPSVFAFPFRPANLSFPAFPFSPAILSVPAFPLSPAISLCPLNPLHLCIIPSVPQILSALELPLRPANSFGPRVTPPSRKSPSSPLTFTSSFHSSRIVLCRLVGRPLAEGQGSGRVFPKTRALSRSMGKDGPLFFARSKKEGRPL